ncbi:MAG: PP2C family serine/threonine-protein phosphatase [Planctomycetales bacterium]|nr:PP2C family serine/threonine-protein phosphatase [Planctomycetales bacterium]
MVGSLLRWLVRILGFSQDHSAPGSPVATPLPEELAEKPPASTWRFLSACVRGTSHVNDGLPCQDYALVRETWLAGESLLIAVCADGAGSAKHAEIAARMACEKSLAVIQRSVRRISRRGLDETALSEEDVKQCFLQARRRLEAQAETDGTPLREYACTLLIAVVAPQFALFGQLGDGAIVLDIVGDEMQTVFWPRRGEYANTTWFLSGTDWESQVQIDRRSSELRHLAMLTDGLQPLALDDSRKRPHAPFFAPMFRALHGQVDVKQFQAPFRAFLESNDVNDRTDDDKTLILASRLARHDSAD